MLIFLVSTSCKGPAKATEDALGKFVNVIPKPVRSDTTGFAFDFDSTVLVSVEPASSEQVQLVAKQVATAIGTTRVDEGSYRSGVIHLKQVNEPGLGKEGYRINIKPDGVQMEANRPAGLFYAVQTFRQLWSRQEDGTIQVATGTIDDVPRYGWRGTMLDVSRHFFDVAEVKRFIDLMTLYKLNVLHLSLSNDQGWRIEIKSWPKLTEIGGSTEVGGGQGGYYTQEQYKEIIRYAADRFVTIVPEIDMPGHTHAALASYPELNCDGKPREVYTGIEVGFSSLCASKEITYQFIDDVVREISALTPGPYFHVGGDEAAATPKPDYIGFINHFHKTVQQNGKRMAAWEEAAQGLVDSTCVVQHWHSAPYARMAADKGARVILSPASRVYLDMKYDSTTTLGLKWAGFIDLQTAYDWEPSTLVEGLPANQIIGVEAPLWTETLENINQVEYMLFPRLPAVAEVAWSSGTRSWPDFNKRMAHHASYFSAHQINFYRSPQVAWK